MANATLHQDDLHGQAARNLAIEMFMAMSDTLSQLDQARAIDSENEREIDRHVLAAQQKPVTATEKSSPIRRKPRGWAAHQARINPPSASLPLQFFADYDEYEIVTPEHRAIMIPNNDEEGMEAITTHLGEHFKPHTFISKEVLEEGARYGNGFIITNEPTHQAFLVGKTIFTTTSGLITKNVRAMHEGKGLTNLDKIIYYESNMTAQGDAVVPHEDHSRRAWYKDPAQIRTKFSCTTEEAVTLKIAFQTLDTTPKMAEKFKTWLSTPEKFNAGFKYFENLSIELGKVTVEDEPEDNTCIINTTKTWTDAEGNEHWTMEHADEGDCYRMWDDADNTADIEMLPAIAYHKLDDPRDDYEPWMNRQPEAFKTIVINIKLTKTLAEVKAVGQSLFKDAKTKAIMDSFSNTQRSVIWDEFHRRKANLSPKLRPLALKALARIADKDVNLSKVASWLHGEGKAKLNSYELSVLWDSWKARRGAKAPKQANLEFQPVPED